MRFCMKGGAIRIGAVGAGGFGLFALQHFTQIPGVELVAMAETHREAAFAMAQRFGIPDIQTFGALVAREDIDLVYISTPHSRGARTAQGIGYLSEDRNHLEQRRQNEGLWRVAARDDARPGSLNLRSPARAKNHSREWPRLAHTRGQGDEAG